MVIPIYILPAMSVIFFVAGGIAVRKKKTEMDASDIKKKTACILFLLFLVFTALSIVIIPKKGQYYGDSIKMLSTTMDKKDVMIIYPQSIDTKNVSLAEDESFLTDDKSKESIRYIDILCNANIIGRKDVLSVTKNEKISQNCINISQCIVKKKILFFWKYSKAYQISISED